MLGSLYMTVALGSYLTAILRVMMLIIIAAFTRNMPTLSVDIEGKSLKRTGSW